MISLIYPINNRADLLDRTLTSICNSKLPITEFEILIIDQQSTDNLKEVLTKYSNKLQIRHIIIDMSKYTSYKLPSHVAKNPAYAWNVGIKQAKGDYIVITSPEIYHPTDILTALHNRISNDNTITYMFTTYAVNEKGNIWRGYYDDKRTSAWLDQDKVENYAGLYFFGAYPKNTLYSIGGIEEQYMEGIWFDDTDFGLVHKCAGFRHIRMPETEAVCHHLHHPVKPRSNTSVDHNKTIYLRRKELYKKGSLTRNNINIDWGSNECIISNSSLP